MSAPSQPQCARPLERKRLWLCRVRGAKSREKLSFQRVPGASSARPGGRPFPWIKLCSVSSLVLPYRTKKKQGEKRERRGSGVCLPLLSRSARVLESGNDFGGGREKLCPFSESGRVFCFVVFHHKGG